MRQNAHTIWSSDPVQRQHFERAYSSVSQQTVMRLIFTIRQTGFYLVAKGVKIKRSFPSVHTNFICAVL